MSGSVEHIKAKSGRLRGELLKSLADPVTGALRESDQTVIKYHGSYQQDDRDQREARRLAKLEPDYSFMIRTRTPGGVVTPTQWLGLDKIAQDYATRGLRITSRQALQFHGVIKTELKPTIAAINRSLMDTLAACGDVNRNVAVAVNPEQSALHAQVYAAAAALSERLLPSTRAYYEIWLDEEQVAGSGSEADEIYGERYLPRKFKIGFAVPPVNDVDVYTQDLGFIAIAEAGELIGFNVTVGGGMGATHNDPETFPRLADDLGFITPDQLQAVAIAVVTTQRDFGNREVRKRARLKYTIEDRGVAWFKAEVEQRSAVKLGPAKPVHFETSGDQFGWRENDSGLWSLGLRIIAGRIEDIGSQRMQSALRAIASLLQSAEPKHGAQFRLTPNQNLLIANVEPALRARIDQLWQQHGLSTQSGNAVLLHAMACVSLPSCGLAMAEAERYLPEFAEQLERLRVQAGLGETPLQLRISGCPNGCSRPYASEIALVGKAPGRYNLMLGGDHLGGRLNVLYRENLDQAQILSCLAPLLQQFAAQRQPEERFGDFLVRKSLVRSKARIPAQLLPDRFKESA